MENRSRTHLSRTIGVTLIELLVTLAIIAILATVVIPSFQSLLMDNRMTTQVNELVTALQGARSLAIARQQHAVLCPSLDQTTCANNTAWQNGWIVFADRNTNQQHDGDEFLLRAEAQTNATLTATTSSGRKRIVFQADGSAGGSNVTLTLCDTRGPALARAIIVSPTGRPRLSRSAANGTALTCP